MKYLSRRLFLTLALAFLSSVLAPVQATAADLYAAIAYSPSTTKYGYAYGKSSRAAAENTARAYARASDARVVIWCKNAWCALARSNRGNAWGAAWGSSKAAASNAALRNCPSGSGKYIAATVFSGRQ